jgi:ERF superfamily.
MKEIASALVKAQKEFGPALKSSTNPAFRSRYADLSACVEAVIDALNNNDIFMMQPTHECDNGVIVETIFIHSSGEQISSGKLHVPATKNDAQGYGSALTYARRYSLMTACGIAPEDDDGNSASKPKAAPAKPAAQPAKAAPPPTKIEGKEGPWQLKVSIEPEGEFADWASIVMDATKLGLEQAANESDVMAIFRNNKNIFDRMKSEPGSSSYDALMEEFKTARNKFKEQA